MTFQVKRKEYVEAERRSFLAFSIFVNGIQNYFTYITKL